MRKFWGRTNKKLEEKGLNTEKKTEGKTGGESILRREPGRRIEQRSLKICGRRRHTKIHKPKSSTHKSPSSLSSAHSLSLKICSHRSLSHYQFSNSGHLASLCHHQHIHLNPSDPITISGKGNRGSSGCLQCDRSPSDANSDHHRPPFLTPPRPEEPPRRPLPKSVNR